MSHELPPATGADLVIAGDLTPARGAAVRDAALALLDRGGIVRIDLDTAPPRPVALQLLVAARASAAKRGVALEFGAHAAAALGRLDHMQPVGRADA